MLEWAPIPLGRDGVCQECHGNAQPYTLSGCKPEKCSEPSDAEQDPRCAVEKKRFGTCLEASSRSERKGMEWKGKDRTGQDRQGKAREGRGRESEKRTYCIQQ